MQKALDERKKQQAVNNTDADQRPAHANIQEAKEDERIKRKEANPKTRSPFMARVSKGDGPWEQMFIDGQLVTTD